MAPVTPCEPPCARKEGRQHPCLLGRSGRVWAGVEAKVEECVAGIPRRRGRSKGSSTAPSEQCGPCRPRTGPVCRFPGESRVWPPAMEVSAVWDRFPSRRRREQEGAATAPDTAHGPGPAAVATGHFYPPLGGASRAFGLPQAAAKRLLRAEARTHFLSVSPAKPA